MSLRPFPKVCFLGQGGHIKNKFVGEVGVSDSLENDDFFSAFTLANIISLVN